MKKRLSCTKSSQMKLRPAADPHQKPADTISLMGLVYIHQPQSQQAFEHQDLLLLMPASSTRMPVW